jgi:phosphohistidine phosphatase
MDKTLLIMRHAKSDWDSGAVRDFDRPLASRGRRDAPKIGKWIKDHQLIPHLIISSPAQRAKETIKLAAEQFAYDKNLIQWNEEIYGAGLSDLLFIISHFPEELNRALIVGHNPGFEDLVAFLMGKDESKLHDKLMPTAALACFNVVGNWNQLDKADIRLSSLIKPKQLST